MNKSKIVVTGSNGFVGGKVIQALFARGYEVTLIDKDINHRLPYNIKQFSVDLVQAHIDELIMLFKDTVIIHLAAVSTSSDCETNPQLALQVNIEVTKKIIDAASSANAKLIFASSEWVYPQIDNNTSYSEDTELQLEQQTNLYAMTKVVGEWLVQKYSSEYCILRFGIIYGERKTPQSAIESIVHVALNSTEIEVGSLATARRFIHVEDVSRGIVRCIEDFESARKRIFNLAGDRLVSLGEVLEIVNNSVDNPLKVRTGNAATSIRNPDVRLFYSTFGWKPEISIETGIKMLIEYVSKQSRRT